MGMMRSIARDMRRAQGLFKYDKKVRGHHNHIQINRSKKENAKKGKFGNGIFASLFEALFSK